MATEAKLERIAREVCRRTKKRLKKDEIGVKVGRVLNKYKVGKHFRLEIDDNALKWERKQEAIEKETDLDGIYVIRTSEPAEKLSAENAVRGYERLADVEQAFRSLKSLELLVRPIHHHLEDRVKSHIFVCLLAYYVQWHLKRAWSALSFADEHLHEHQATKLPHSIERTGHTMPQHLRARRGDLCDPDHEGDRSHAIPNRSLRSPRELL